MNSAKKKRIGVNVHLCFRQLDCSVMLTSRSHPWSCIPFDRWDTTKITSVIKDQPWRSNEQCFELREVDVLGSTQILLVIGSEGTGDVSKSVTVLVQAEEEHVHWRDRGNASKDRRGHPPILSLPKVPDHTDFLSKRSGEGVWRKAWLVVTGSEQSENASAPQIFPNVMFSWAV